MRKVYLAIVLLLGVESGAFSQTQTIYVTPAQTDARYSGTEGSHYIVRNTAAQSNTLVLFMGGSSANAVSYATFCKYAASIGFDVISLSYPNDVATPSLTASFDSLIFNKYHQELCFGTPVSADVSVDSLNSIYTRTVKLLQYLSSTYPAQHWEQYLATPTTPDWRKIIVAGHSQGAGHACYLAKVFPVQRVAMFSGPNDFSTAYNKSANWIRQVGITPAEKHFALLHLRDEIVPFNRQFVEIKDLGMLATVDSTLIDKLAAPYDNANVLYTNIPAASYHASTVGDNPILPAVWKYMLTEPVVVTGINDPFTTRESLRVYPNPTSSDLIVEIPQSAHAKRISIFDAYGQLVFEKNFQNHDVQKVDFASFKKGIYFIKIGNSTTRVVKN